MSSYVDMSLEDIIKKKRENTRAKTKPTKPKRPGGIQLPMMPNNAPIADARNKIISKKRTQITDAREKLSQLAKHKDARLKLEQMRQERARIHGHGRNAFLNRGGKFTRALPHKERVFTDASRQVVSHPLAAKSTLKRQINMQRQSNRLTEGRTIENTRYSDTRYKPKPKPILRTVENDLEIIDDPMEEAYPVPKVSLLNRKASLQLKIVAHNNDSRENRFATIHRTTDAEKEMSPPRPPSILKKRPMAALKSDAKVQKPDKPPNLEFRIIVSNLRNTVTAGDIEELFGDVGGMIESRLVRPGTAEVMYKSQEDAQRAVDLYHNRQLDGQPMNCLLVTPRSPATTARSSNKPALYSTNSNVEPDISTFHKVLFSNL